MMHSLYGTLCQDPLAAAVALMDPGLTSKDTTFTKIFVGGLPYHTTDKTLREYFEQFGDIEEAVVITDRQTGKSRGYGFVTMKDRAGAERACKDPNPIIDGRKANVNLAYLGAKPRNNLQLGLPLPLQASVPTLFPGRLGLPQLYYSTSPYLTSSGLMIPPVSPLSPTAAAASQYLDYSTAAAAAYGNAQSAAAAAAAAYEPLAYGYLPASAYGGLNAQSLNANVLAAQTAAYQAAAAAAASGLSGGADRQ